MKLYIAIRNHEDGPFEDLSTASWSARSALEKANDADREHPHLATKRPVVRVAVFELNEII
ncbi:hypothetical protein [Desulfococcus multivorans]|uniref:Uncharacterized protein n=1 Tax=Desulfococcus multivorans DSM 2059 TaxID=1121405 RepID=S7TAQ3_DESML|nr:hypothetical protein [Desulfococcus multivorans]AQV01753.1 hypothetical protein B2D07_13940 [Desulfococcus multivorans]EPR34207.1 hypothetical protein dsmv_3419 [Desulfococcus multivorans DSM 2059]SKA20143.1 hypothetical protein SAMN02745446_03246 [Desulfococcus multivorans DSM 2059]